VRAILELLVERRGRFEPALELEGLGRAAFVLVANCSPYTYVGRLGVPIVPQASFDCGLDLVAPVRVRPLSLPRLAVSALTGHGQQGARGLLSAHDLDRLVAHCDAAMPLQLDGEDVGDVELVEFEAEREAVIVLV
jgi:diacylglycerol kinase family enzyme